MTRPGKKDLIVRAEIVYREGEIVCVRCLSSGLANASFVVTIDPVIVGHRRAILLIFAQAHAHYFDDFRSIFVTKLTGNELFTHEVERLQQAKVVDDVIRVCPSWLSFEQEPVRLELRSSDITTDQK